ncbi:MAG: ammonium transporter [Actinobacteria bacterium]|nr:ammonium transporter [Actinomycetota bacterium]
MQLSAGDTAWVLVSAAMVLIMTPGLAFFYGGLVRGKSVVNMMMMSFVTIGVVSILWVFFGYSWAFGDSGSSLIGQWTPVGLEHLLGTLPNNGGQYPIPHLAFVGFQLMFAIITPALISGAIADRAKFSAWIVFVTLWTSIVYFPVAHWVFDFGTKAVDGSVTGVGWLTKLGLLDFAGGTAVHINAGAAGLALAIVLGRRVGFRKDPMRPHNIPLVLIGAGLLWFGWFGFNAGSALGANDTAALALLNTQVATGAALVGWLIVERIREGHFTSVGAASGAVAGLVAITPACAFVSPAAAVAVGLIAGGVCAFAISLKHKLGFDDSLDVVGIHLFGGIAGCLLIGFFATTTANSAGANGLFYGGGLELLKKQALGSGAVAVYSFVVTLVLAMVIDKTMGFRISADDEVEGIDSVVHGELAYARRVAIPDVVANPVDDHEHSMFSKTD